MFWPWKPHTHDVRTTVEPGSSSRSPASFVRPYTDRGFGLVPLDVGLGLGAVEDVVGRHVDHVGADPAGAFGHVPGAEDVHVVGASTSVSQRSTAVKAAAWITTSGRTEVMSAEHGVAVGHVGGDDVDPEGTSAVDRVSAADGADDLVVAAGGETASSSRPSCRRLQ